MNNVNIHNVSKIAMHRDYFADRDFHTITIVIHNEEGQRTEITMYSGQQLNIITDHK